MQPNAVVTSLPNGMSMAEANAFGGERVAPAIRIAARSNAFRHLGPCTIAIIADDNSSGCFMFGCGMDVGGAGCGVALRVTAAETCGAG